MCMEDILLGRKTQAIQYNPLLIVATPTLVLPRNFRRIALIISPCLGGIMTWGITNQIALGTGFQIPNNGIPQTYNIKDHGQLVTGEIWMLANTVAGMLANIIEVVLDSVAETM